MKNIVDFLDPPENPFLDSGLMHEGDELREVNGVLMQDKKPEEIISILVQWG